VEVDEESIAVPVTLHGDWGNDKLQGGAAGDKLYGGPGNDEILGRGGSDTLHGEDDDDLLVGGDASDVIFGGSGNDYLLGGDGNDLLLGEAGDDLMYGEAGNDQLFGGLGTNTMDGGDGNDAIYGGEGVDMAYGAGGDDLIVGLAGDDQLRGEEGHDTISGDDGNDLVDGGEGDDQIDGDNGNDVLSGDDGNDVISGGNGNDWLDGKYGDDVVYGVGGNDFVAGGPGADEVNGGSGSNQVAQEYPSGYVNYGVVTQGLWGVDHVIGAAEWVGDKIEDIVSWTLDKAESIGLRFMSWATSLDNRLMRLNQDLFGVLSNWPWEADFWKGLGRVVIDAVEVAGLGEAWEIAMEILQPWQRGLTDREIDLARGVYGSAINWNMVRLNEYSVGAKLGRAHVTGYIINSWGDLDDRTLIHELIHVWQYEEDGYVYAPEALDQQDGGKGYIYGGESHAEKVADLRAKMSAGQGFSAYNREQQGEVVADYFMLRQDAREYEQRGEVAPLWLRQDLDLYIHFVKEVSTLSPEKLDTPDFVFRDLPVFDVVAPTRPTTALPVRPATTLPAQPATPLPARPATTSPARPARPIPFDTEFEIIRGSLRQQ
jgi:hypothetical protein